MGRAVGRQPDVRADDVARQRRAREPAASSEASTWDADMAFTKEQVAKLEAAISAGVLSVRYADRTVTYQSLDSMRRLLKQMRDEIGQHQARHGVAASCASTSRGPEMSDIAEDRRRQWPTPAHFPSDLARAQCRIDGPVHIAGPGTASGPQ